MRTLFCWCLGFLVLAGCKKEKEAEVEIYLLRSFNRTINQSTQPVTSIITDARLSDNPLVADKDIAFSLLTRKKTG